MPRSRATRRRPRARIAGWIVAATGMNAPAAHHGRADVRLHRRGIEGDIAVAEPGVTARRDRLQPLVVLGGAALTDSVPRFVYHASTPFASHHPPISSIASSIAWAAATARSGPCRSISVGSSSHQPVANPPLRPDGPPPQMSASSRTIRAPGACSAIRIAVHSPV